MDVNTVSRSPREEGELEDGEICDDETEESVPFRRGDGNRPGGRGAPPPRTRKPHQHPPNMLPHMGHQPPDFRILMPYNLGPHGHGPFPPGHRQQCGPSGPDRPPSPLPLPLPPPPGHGPHGEPSPRSSFWERSHGALGRFRHRSMSNCGRGAWNRGNRPPPGRYGPGESHSNRTDSPSRKQKLLGRTQTRKAAHSVSKPENSVDESFEDLLSKYKQIQLELECIRKEETMALEPKASPVREDTPDNAASITEARPAPEAAHSPAGPEDPSELEKAERKVFQAFNIKPLRQKLPTPVNLDELKRKLAGQDGEGGAVKEGECLFLWRCDAGPAVKVEEEELSELQLRLLALQSASKKWQQKEQQVMKKSKDRLTRAAQEKRKPHPNKKMITAKQAFRKQQLRTWKLQQQREQEEKRRQDEEERRKREDEIRRIRDLSNQDEQYNRFMKLVGGKMRTRSKSRDREHRKSTGKQGLDASGNLYQYDNYDEVAMDTDSETSSPGEETELLAVKLHISMISHPEIHEPRYLLCSLQLPRHKSVVVSLNDSDDSDSDLDACSSTQTVFGGLEFMIKEARRSVEAAKPKGASGSEKENNPVRTPEALPEAKKAEYRLLKEEIASREKQKMLKDHSPSPRSSASPAGSESLRHDLIREAGVKVSDCDSHLLHRELLQRDEAVLRHLLQQELKKRESLKAAEAKVAKLREQLQASDKIVSANKTLLKKLQEQVHRVEHRVSIKKSLAVRLEQELAQAQLAAGRGSNKLQRVDGAPRGSERHFAELIAQKQRLQQLESEYALKIQKLKEAQALRNKGIQIPHPSPSSPFPLPQPSLHDLTQDKLTLDSEDVAEAEDHESEPATAPAPAPAAKGPRRHSLRQSSSSFTKPNLEQLSSTPAKDSSTAKPAKTATSSEAPAEMFAGLDLDALKLRYQQQARLGELLLTELQNLEENDDRPPTGQVLPVEMEATTSQSGSSELRPVPFGAYHSPLLVFRSYRFSPYYRTKEKLSLSSVTYSNSLEPRKCFCRFDLTGTCNDDDCRWQHMRNCTLTGNQLFQDILSYNLSLIGCSDGSSDDDISAATEKYMKKLFGTNKGRMGVDQKAVLLVSKVNESKRHVPPFTTCKDVRRWRPKPSAQSGLGPEDDGDLSALDVCVTSEDKRYFVSETDDISNLETSVLESPRDTQLWIKLAFKYLSQNETYCLEAALNTLSRALESNCDNPEVWSHYLSLFSRRGSREEVQEMCEMAVEHAPDYRVWWNYLNLESSFEGKDYVCDRLLQFLVTEASPSSGVTDKLSFQLMESLLYRVHLNLFTGRMESALAILQNALKSAHDRSIADHLTTRDRALVWLSYIHLTEFDRLPSGLYDPAESGPSRLVSRESFLLPWKTPQDVSTPLDILIALFQDAVHQCSDESLSPSERTLACLPLHTNLIFLYRLLQRYDEGVALCESLLEACPESCALRDALADLHIRKGDGDQAVSMWLHALAECPNNAEVFYHSCKFLMSQVSSGVHLVFVFARAGVSQSGSHFKKPADVLRYILISGRRSVVGSVENMSGDCVVLFSRWQWLHGSAEDTVDAFERALGSAMQLDELHKLWMDYLVFSSSQLTRGPTSSQSRLISDLVQRCLSTVPSRLEVPFNPAEFWSCYRFHNKVVSFYLSCLPQSQHALVLERLRYAMPNNTELGLRYTHSHETHTHTHTHMTHMTHTHTHTHTHRQTDRHTRHRHTHTHT
uniref:Zinc finger C3H1-type containing n=1 Tax=Seriola lalandi dorsalis TaxID=1841481 RepID=A0A3B4XYE3_SERLL